MFLMSIGAMVMGEVSIMPMLRLMEYMFFVFRFSSFFNLLVGCGCASNCLCVIFIYVQERIQENKNWGYLFIFVF